MTQEDKELFIKLIEIIETDVLDGNRLSALTSLNALRKKLAQEDNKELEEETGFYNRFDSDELYSRW